jgi:uncharacterized protein DUF7009
MKLRFRKNSLRLRLNRNEVRALAEDKSLRENVVFPGGGLFSYQLSAAKIASASAAFSDGIIRVALPADGIRKWSSSDEIGLYYKLNTAAGPLDIAVEKDLECVDAPDEERDPFAYPRKAAC